MAFIAERVAPNKRIRRLEFIDQIPKSASGKILRRLLVEKERAQVAGQIDTAASQLVSSFLLGSIRESYVFVIECLERQEVGSWTARVSRCGFRRRAG